MGLQGLIGGVLAGVPYVRNFQNPIGIFAARKETHDEDEDPNLRMSKRPLQSNHRAP